MKRAELGIPQESNDVLINLIYKMYYCLTYIFFGCLKIGLVLALTIFGPIGWLLSMCFPGPSVWNVVGRDSANLESEDTTWVQV